MGPTIRVNGGIIELMGEASSFMQLGMFMKESGEEIRHVDWVFILVNSQVALIMGSGLTICNTGMALKAGKIRVPMRDNSFKVKNVE